MTYTVDTPRSRRRFRWPRLPLGEGQAAWTTRALMLLAPLLSFTLVEYLNYNNPWTDFTSLQIALNLAWYYLGGAVFSTSSSGGGPRPSSGPWGSPGAWAWPTTT